MEEDSYLRIYELPKKKKKKQQILVNATFQQICCLSAAYFPLFVSPSDMTRGSGGGTLPFRERRWRRVRE